MPPRRETLDATHVRCVHCRKEFLAAALAPETPRAGYKCPHCNLFMPLERVDGANEERPSAARLNAAAAPPSGR